MRLAPLVVAAGRSLVQLDLDWGRCQGVDIRELTIPTAHARFLNGTLTSLALTSCYLKRIRAMNPLLNAVIEVNPDARRIARRLDAQLRDRARPVGPLHGIPILAKDNIATGDRMNTTAGAWALLGAKPRRDADVVQRLRRAGAIILGKSNLSEFAG